MVRLKFSIISSATRGAPPRKYEAHPCSAAAFKSAGIRSGPHTRPIQSAPALLPAHTRGTPSGTVMVDVLKIRRRSGSRRA